MNQLATESLEITAVMHPFPHSIGVDQTLRTAKDMLQEYGVRHLPVQKGGQLLGIVSDRDINFALATDRATPDELIVSDVFTEEPFIVEPGAKVAHVAGRMAQDRLGCALVVEAGKLVGIFTTVDACRVLSKVLSN